MTFLRILFLFLLTVATSHTACAQADPEEAEPAKMRTRYVLFTTPVKKDTQVHGIALGLMAVPWGHAKRLHINGLNLELEPWAALMAGVGVVMPVVALFKKMPDGAVAETAPPDSAATTQYQGTIIRGVSVSGGGLASDTRLYGLSLNGLLGMAESYGVMVSGLMNGSDDFSGLQLAAVGNMSAQGRGLQIGLFNTCLNGRVLQLGLLNRIGNRITPVVNFRFRKSALPKG